MYTPLSASPDLIPLKVKTKYSGPLSAADRMDATEMLSISFCMRRAYFCAKYRTSKGMSSGRSRNGGIPMGIGPAIFRWLSQLVRRSHKELNIL